MSVSEFLPPANSDLHTSLQHFYKLERHTKKAKMQQIPANIYETQQDNQDVWKPCSDERELYSGDKTGCVICAVRSTGCRNTQGLEGSSSNHSKLEVWYCWSLQS